MRERGAMLMLVMLLVGSAMVLAEEIDVEIIEARDEVEAGTIAEFTLKITNNGFERDVFNIGSDEFNVYPFSEFAQKIEAKPFQVKLDSEESAIVRILIKTLDIAPPNKYYDSKVVVSSVIRPAVKKVVDLKTYIASAKNIISVIPRLPTKITPGQEIRVPVKLKNRSRLTFENLEVTATTDVPGISEPLQISLKSQEEKEEELIIMLDAGTNPGQKKITITVYEGGELRGSFVAEVEILAKDRVEEEREVKKGFLASTTTIARENIGNIPSEQRIEATYNLFQRIFSSMTPPPETEFGKVIWEFTLRPEEKKTIEIETNYRPLLYGFIIIAIFTAIVFLSIERSVVIKKRIFHGKEIIEGVKEYKLFLLVRNGKNYPLQDVKVMDLVPNVVDLMSDFGSLKPDRVQHGERATRLLWNVIKLDPGEERVFSYKVRKKRNIVGEVVLPTAIIQFADNKDKFMQVHSMRVVLE